MTARSTCIQTPDAIWYDSGRDVKGALPRPRAGRVRAVARAGRRGAEWRDRRRGARARRAHVRRCRAGRRSLGRGDLPDGVHEPGAGRAGRARAAGRALPAAHPARRGRADRLVPEPGPHLPQRLLRLAAPPVRPGPVPRQRPHEERRLPAARPGAGLLQHPSAHDRVRGGAGERRVRVERRGGPLPHRARASGPSRAPRVDAGGRAREPRGGGAARRGHAALARAGRGPHSATQAEGRQRLPAARLRSRAMRLPFSGKIFLALGGLVCLAIATALGVLEPLSRLRAEEDIAARFERARRAFAELQSLRKRELADQIALVASHNAQLRTVLSTASLGDDLGFDAPASAADTLRDANLRLRSLIPSLPLAERADVLVVLAGTGELLWSRADPERAGDDLSTLEPFRETLERGEAEGSWTSGANRAGGPRLVPERQEPAVYLVVAAPVVFEEAVHGVVLAGTRIDAETLASLRAVSGLDLALLSRGALVESTLPPAEAAALTALAPRTESSEQLALAGRGYRTRLTRVSAGGADDARFLLLASTAAEQAFVRRIRDSLLAVGAGVLAGAMLAALALARGITRPVAALAQAARRVGAGELDTEITLSSRDELGELGAA